jgi:hypothetical protein
MSWHSWRASLNIVLRLRNDAWKMGILPDLSSAEASSECAIFSLSMRCPWEAFSAPLGSAKETAPLTASCTTVDPTISTKLVIFFPAERNRENMCEIDYCYMILPIYVPQYKMFW